MEGQMIPDNKGIQSKNNEARGITVPDFKM
jgi:hypothetical protein